VERWGTRLGLEKKKKDQQEGIDRLRNGGDFGKRMRITEQHEKNCNTHRSAKKRSIIVGAGLCGGKGGGDNRITSRKGKKHQGRGGRWVGGLVFSAKLRKTSGKKCPAVVFPTFPIVKSQKNLEPLGVNSGGSTEKKK